MASTPHTSEMSSTVSAMRLQRVGWSSPVVAVSQRRLRRFDALRTDRTPSTIMLAGATSSHPRIAALQTRSPTPPQNPPLHGHETSWRPVRVGRTRPGRLPTFGLDPGRPKAAPRTSGTTGDGRAVAQRESVCGPTRSSWVSTPRRVPPHRHRGEAASRAATDGSGRSFRRGSARAARVASPDARVRPVCRVAAAPTSAALVGPDQSLGWA